MLFRWGKAQRIAPRVIATDRIFPVHYWDHYTKDAIMNFMLHFNHRLDAEKLRSSLAKLLNRRDGWRKLGARVRKSANAKLEYHIPEKYTKERPAFSYHLAPYGMSIADHPLASRLRSSIDTAKRPMIVGRGDDLLPLMRHSNDAVCFEDYLYEDRPMLSLKIVTFNDATLVSLCSSHILFDAMGRKELLDAWSLTLQGREEEVSNLVEDDPLQALGRPKVSERDREADTASRPAEPGDAPAEPYKFASKQLGLRQLITLGLRQWVDKITHLRPVEESRVVCVPAAFVTLLRHEAMATSHVQRTNGKPAFLSDGDILCEWWSRQIISSRIKSSSESHQTVSIINMLGLRRLLKQDKLLQDKDAIVANAMLTIPTFIRAKDAVTKPLGHVASALRRAITQLGTRQQIDALLRLQRATNDKKGMPAVFGDAGMHMIVCTNWTKAGFYDVDFGAAIINATDTHPSEWEIKEMSVAKPANVHMHVMTKGTPAFLMSIFCILGKDADGNFWIVGTLRKEYWPKIEEQLRLIG